MKIVVVGGGSGGHITPIIAVIKEIWQLKPRARIDFWTDKKFHHNVVKSTTGMGPSITVQKLFAGKLRRYTNFHFIDYLKHFDIVLANLIDFIKIAIGFCQSFIRLKKFKPDAIFLKGGFVCLPVGLAARLLHIPYIIHDSDTVPGLTNRILAKHATQIATGMPLEYYKYPASKAEWTGIPTDPDFRPATKKHQQELKRSLGFSPDIPLTVITGGSQGSQHINEATAEILPQLTKFTNALLIAGRIHYHKLLTLKNQEIWIDGKLTSPFRMLEFSADMPELFAAADLVISRAGASTMTELAAMRKPVIMIPYEKLPGHHQVKNAEAYARANAAAVIEDDRMYDQPGLLLQQAHKLIKNPAKRAELAQNLSAFAKTDAAARLAQMIIAAAGSQEPR